MKRIPVVGAVIGVLAIFCVPVAAVKLSFDLSKGPVAFSYDTIGAYNPLRITILGKNGSGQTALDTRAYQCRTYVESLLDELYALHIGSVSATAFTAAAKGKLGVLLEGGGYRAEARLEGLEGMKVLTVLTPSGLRLEATLSKDMSVDASALGAAFESIGKSPGMEELEIHATIRVDAESGQLIVQDSRPEPLPGEVLGQKLGMPKDLASDIIEEFGRARVEAALENALSHNGTVYAQGSSIAGGAASVVSDGSLSINSLSPRAVFDLSLQGLRYEGYLRDSTLYMRLLHPANGVSIRDMRVILTVVELEPPEPLHGPHIVLWDVFPYDYQAGCYLYHLNSTGWRPGAYEVYIDVGKIVNFKLPITITDWHQVVARRG